MIFTAPNVSTAGNFLTIAFFLDMDFTPNDNTIATIATNPSGIAATAKLIEVINISTTCLPCNIPTTKIIPQIAKAP